MQTINPVPWKPNKEASKNWLFKDIRNIAFVCGAAFFVCSIFALILGKLGIAKFWMYSSEADNPLQLTYGCVFAPIFEELIFRWLPIIWVMAIVNNAETFKRWRWYFAGIISIVFGVAHFGYFSIFIQGVSGFGFCYLYFKNRYGWLSAVVAHSMWNFALTYILPSTGYHPSPLDGFRLF